MAAVVLLFFVQGRLHLAPAVIAMSGAAVALLWVRPDVEETLRKIDWSVLLFFAGLFVALVSAVVDNIPFTIAMIPIIQGIGGLGVEVIPLWWALALGAGFGGNGTPIGSTANVVTVSLSEKTRHPITTRIWMRSGLPVMLATCVVASIMFILMFEWMRTG